MVFYHIEEDWNGGFSQLRFRYERHIEEVSDHIRHEIDLVMAQVKPHLTHLQPHLLAHVFVLKNKANTIRSHSS